MCDYRSSQNSLLTKEMILRKPTKNGKFKFKTWDDLTNAFKTGFSFVNVWFVDLLSLYLNKQKPLKWVVSFPARWCFYQCTFTTGEEINCYNSLITWERIKEEDTWGFLTNKKTVKNKIFFFLNRLFVACSTFSSNGILHFLIVRKSILRIFAWCASYV